MTQEPDPRVTTEMTAPEAVNVGDDLDITATYENVGDMDRIDHFMLVIQGRDPGVISFSVVSITTEVNDPDTDDLLEWTFVKNGNLVQATWPLKSGTQRRVGEGNILTIKARIRVNEALDVNAVGIIRLTDIDSQKITQYPESVPHFIAVG